MSPSLPLSHGPSPSQTALQHTQLMLTSSQLAGVRQTPVMCNDHTVLLGFYLLAAPAFHAFLSLLSTSSPLLSFLTWFFVS